MHRRIWFWAVAAFMVTAGCGEMDSSETSESPKDSAESVTKATPPLVATATHPHLETCAEHETRCIPGTPCYAFKSCYEDVQDDDTAVEVCRSHNPTGAAEWSRVVACVCHNMIPSPDSFCNGTQYGHPHG